MYLFFLVQLDGFFDTRVAVVADVDVAGDAFISLIILVLNHDDDDIVVDDDD